MTRVLTYYCHSTTTVVHLGHVKNIYDDDAVKNASAAASRNHLRGF